MFRLRGTHNENACPHILPSSTSSYAVGSLPARLLNARTMPIIRQLTSKQTNKLSMRIKSIPRNISYAIQGCSEYYERALMEKNYSKLFGESLFKTIKNYSHYPPMLNWRMIGVTIDINRQKLLKCSCYSPMLNYMCRRGRAYLE